MNTSLPEAVLLTQMAATFYMIGLIWFVQRVHYPLFAAVGTDGFAAYEQQHAVRTNPVVGVAMIVEACTALAAVVWLAPGVPAPLAWAGLALLAIVWVSTAALQVPRHAELSSGFDARAHRRLVRSNWIRTVAWSLRGIAVVWMVVASSNAK